MICNSSPHYSSDSSGFTVPVWVCAAAKAATEVLIGQSFNSCQNIYLPNSSEQISVSVASAASLSHDKSLAITFCDPGLGLDLTNGLEIWTYVSFQKIDQGISPENVSSDLWLEVLPGFGVGTFESTGEICLSGFAKQLLDLNLNLYRSKNTILQVEVVFPAGKLLAERTSNKAFGVVDGLALIGTQATVQQSASPEQLKENIQYLRTQCKQDNFSGEVIFVIGENGRQLASKLEFPAKQIIKTGNWLGPLLVTAAEEDVKKLMLFGYHGKLIKLAGGVFHTHHHLADCRLEILISLAVKARIPLPLIHLLEKSQSIEEAFLLLDQRDSKIANNLWLLIASEIEKRSHLYLKRYLASSIEISVVMFDRQRIIRWANQLGIHELGFLGLTI